MITVFEDPTLIPEPVHYALGFGLAGFGFLTAKWLRSRLSGAVAA